MKIFFNLMTKFWIPNKFQLSCGAKWSETKNLWFTNDRKVIKYATENLPFFSPDLILPGLVIYFALYLWDF